MARSSSSLLLPLLLLLLLSLPLYSPAIPSPPNSTSLESAPANTTDAITSKNNANPTPPTANMTSTNTASTQRLANGMPTNATRARGCGEGLAPVYSYLCDLDAVWGVVVEALASLGFLLAVGLALGLVGWVACGLCARRTGSGRWGHWGGRGCPAGGEVALLLFLLLGCAGLFALVFAFVIQSDARTCPTRVFLFGVLFAQVFSSLLALALWLPGPRGCSGRGGAWGALGLAVALTLVQVVIAVEWLVLVLVRDGLPCYYSQAEFILLQVYVLVLLATALGASLLRVGCLFYRHSYGYDSSAGSVWARVQSGLLCLVLVLCVGVWVVWITLLIRGNPEMGRRPRWDDPVLSVALLTCAACVLLGAALPQFLHLLGLGGGEAGGAKGKGGPPDFRGWTSPTTLTGLGSERAGRENSSYVSSEGAGEEPVEEKKKKKRGNRKDPELKSLKSPYESGYTMTEIDPDTDFSIPRPQTAAIAEEPYNYGHRLSD
ncbi:G-protein coupled receptor family C group 5 member B isoform X1 [Amia ocellicauda]